jgi:hypothetical protein
MEKKKGKRILIKNNNKINNASVVAQSSSIISTSSSVNDALISTDSIDINVVSDSINNPTISTLSTDVRSADGDDEVLSPYNNDIILDGDSGYSEYEYTSRNSIFENDAEEDEPFYIGISILIY